MELRKLQPLTARKLTNDGQMEVELQKAESKDRKNHEESTLVNVVILLCATIS